MITTTLPVRYVLLRDALEWEGSRTGLSVRPDGALQLTRVAAPDDPVRIAPPYDPDPSGIAIDRCGRIFVADGEHHQMFMELPACGFEYPLTISNAAGVAVARDVLYAADPVGARVIAFHVPSLEQLRTIDTGLSEPTGVAVDASDRLYVLDRVVKRIVRFGADGTADAAYNAAMAAHSSFSEPSFFALGEDDALFVSDAAANVLLAFDSDGGLKFTLSIAGTTPPARPRALAAHNGTIYVADAASGGILVFDVATRAHIGSVPRFKGPVAAMAVDAGGNLFVKTDRGRTYRRLAAGAGYVATGVLEAGPFDAGIENDWERVVVESDPAQGDVTLATLTSSTEATPAAPDWRSVPALDALLARDQGPAPKARGGRRFLWLRVTVTSRDGRTSPLVRQVRAQTIGRSYLEQLPRIYARDDAPSRFLERLLALARSVMEDWDSNLEGMPRSFDPATAPGDALPRIAQWLGFSPPHTIDPAALRELLARMPALYERRGTVEGIRDFAEQLAGVRPHVVEAFHARRVWLLGETSMLGFDTALAAAEPDGFVAPGHVRTDPAYAGLRGDYYAGSEFDRHVARRTDRTIDFDAARPATPVENNQPLDRFSVRWSGQVRPRFSETCTFFVTPGAGVRVWIDGRPLIDTWTTTSAVASESARILLDGARWYPIVLELKRHNGEPVARLEWSSRSQTREVVPATALYSVLDDRADLTAADIDAIEVGAAIVGESGPLAASGFGTMSFAEHAHLFTVIAPAALCAEPSRRAALRDVIEVEKPAHTDYHLCFPDARMRVGFQARLGIDAIVAEGPPAMRLGEAALDRDTFLAPKGRETV